MKATHFLFLFLLGSAPALAAQTCDTEKYPLSIHPEQYTDNNNGTVTDDRSKLMWMRCSLGQDWSGSTCTGKPGGYTWQAAQDAASKLNKNGYAGHSDWRLPQIPELAMITERQCANPRTNNVLFPETPASFFWTATEPADPGYAYALSFGPEGATFKNRKDALNVRLVRAGMPMPASPAKPK